MSDWEVTVVTDSNYLKTVRVDDCITRTDAEAAALGMTGGKTVVVSNPKTYYDDKDYFSDYHNSQSSNSSFDSSIGALGGVAFLLLLWFWKIILIVGVIALAIWLFLKWIDQYS
jgi:hypothetical protein